MAKFARENFSPTLRRVNWAYFGDRTCPQAENAAPAGASLTGAPNLGGERTPHLSLLLQEVYGDGTTNLSVAESAIFTRADSGSGSLEQLKGRSFAFGETITALGDFSRGPNWQPWPSPRRLPARHQPAPRPGAGGRWRWSLEAGVASLEHVSPLAGPGGRFKILSHLHARGNAWLATTNLGANPARALTNALPALRNSDGLVRFDPKLTGFKPARPADYERVDESIEAAMRFNQPR